MISAFSGVVMLAQGTIEFSNWNVPFLDESGARLTGTNYSAQLYAGNTADTLMPMSEPVSFLTGSASGFFRGTVAIPFAPAGASVWVQVRAWETTAGPTFERAAAAGGWAPFSNILFVHAGGGGSPPILPAALTGLRFLGSGRLPRIGIHPASQTVEPGQDVRFEVAAVNGPLSYQWRRAGVVLPGKTNAILTISNVKPAQSGNYDVVVSNPAGIQISQIATLTVNVSPGTPVILRQPANQRASVGDSVSLSVIATGESPLLYQWYEGSSGDIRSLVDGATDSIYIVRVSSSSRSFWVRIQNAVGVTDSNSAVVAPDPSADPLDQWIWRSPIPQGNGLSGITYGNGQFVAVGDAGSIITSLDGLSWMRRRSGTVHPLHSVVYGADKFVAIGDAGTVLTSADGVNWSEHSTFTDFQLLSVTYGNGMFVVVGEGGAALISTNGFDWNSQSTGRFYELSGATFGNGLFVATGDSVLTSEDGSTWRIRVSDLHDPFSGTAFADGRFFAIGVSNLISPDGVVWSASSSGEISGFSAATAADGILIAVGPRGAIRSSVDGQTWFARNSGTDESLWAVSHGSGLSVGVGDHGAIVTSPDGVDWTLRTSGVDGTPSSVAYGDGMFVAVTAGPGASILMSRDGVVWTKRTPPAGGWLNAVAYRNGTFVVVGELGIILTSSNGVDWTRRVSGSLDWLADVTYGNGTFVVLTEGAQPGILTSSDGITWTSREPGVGPLPPFLGAAYGAGLFVAVGGLPGGLNPILTSPDGEKWTVRDSPTRYQLWSATYGNGTFVAVGLGGTIMTSNDGIQWSDRSVGTLTRLFGIRYGNGYFVAVGDKGTIMTSRDGVEWTNRNSGTVDSLSGVAFGNGGFIVLGGGTILQSGLVDPPFQLSAPRVLEGTFSCLVDAEPGRLLVIQVSPDLIHWMTLTNLTVTNRTTAITDANANEQTDRFYRISESH